MADSLLQNLTELTSPALTDFLYMVADPAGTPADRKVQFSTVVNRVTSYSKILDAGGNGDYTTLATALAALAENDVLFIRNGTYTGGVTISTPNVTLIGESRNGVIIQSIPDSWQSAISVTAAHVTIQTLKIDGLRDTQGTGDTGAEDRSCIRVRADYFTLNDVWLFEPYNAGLYADANYGRVTNCFIQNRATNSTTLTSGKFAHGIFLSSCQRWAITDTMITGFAQGIGLWWGCSHNVVAFNRLIDNYGMANGTVPRSAIEDYGADTPNHQNIVIGNIIDGSTKLCLECASGVIGSQYISNMCLNSGMFSTPGTEAVMNVVEDVNEPTYDIVVANNSFTGSIDRTVRGMYVNASGAVQITGNTFIDCKASGERPVILTGNTRPVFRNNTMHHCDGGLSIRSNFPAIVDGNTFFDPASTSDMIAVFNAQNVISNNMFDANDVNLYGVVVYSTAGSNHRITQNTFTNFVNRCVDLRAAQCLVTGNTIQSTAQSVFLDKTSTQSIVRDNVIDCNSIGAVYIDTGAVNHVIQENTLIGAVAGIYNDSGNTTNQTAPNHTGTFSRTVGILKALGAQTVGATQATIAHGLAYTPTEVQVTMTSAGTIWKSAASDGTNIYLTADDAGRTAEVFVR
jgi:hypothetical protein